MPHGATAVDFAYAVHTDVGNHCSAARINHELVPLRTELRNGDLVEIVTSQKVVPNPVWLTYVKTGRARSKIRHFLRTMQNEESARLGERLLRQELLSLGVVPISIPAEAWTSLVKANGQHTLEAFVTETELFAGVERVPFIRGFIVLASILQKTTWCRRGGVRRPARNLMLTRRRDLKMPVCCEISTRPRVCCYPNR